MGVEDFEFTKERVFDENADDGFSDEPVASAYVQWRAT